MLRKLNFTERAKLPRSSVGITLRRDPDGVLAFDVHFALEAIALPPHASVFIEATYRNSYMRFDCGTVSELSPPADRRLTAIDGTHPRFRVKIVDNAGDQHRVVAMAETIAAAAEGIDPSARMPLLPVDFKDLGEQIWRLQFEPDTPVLELNNRIEGIESMAKSDGRFFAFVYPAAVREILTRILLIDEYAPDEESGEWWSLWLRWACHYAADPAPRDEEDRALWIDEVVTGFCATFNVVTRISDSVGREH